MRLKELQVSVHHPLDMDAWVNDASQMPAIIKTAISLHSSWDSQYINYNVTAMFSY